MSENEGYVVLVDKDEIRIGSKRRNENVLFGKWVTFTESEGFIYQKDDLCL